MSLFKNIHKIASNLIPRQKVQFRKGNGRTISDSGLAKSSYGEWQSATVHLQPGFVSSNNSKNINSEIYSDMGLDFSKVKFTIWIDDTDIDALRDSEVSDQFKINDRIYNVVGVADWLQFDGWKQLYIMEVLK